MLLLASTFFLTLLQCSYGQKETSITPADCHAVERDAGVALDLVNRHRRDGYAFGLFRVADAHQLHVGNSSILYLTLDVVETECPVLSKRHWESCEYGDLYTMDFGQCKIITYTNQLLKKPQLYGFNCTLSTVPPDLLECKDCPVKVEILEVTEQHKNIAAEALKKFNRQSNHTNYFKVDKVEKAFKLTASHEGHSVAFSIKETNCSKSTEEADQALECDFLDDWHAHVGFCKARIISDPDEPDGTDISCEIYKPWLHDCRRPPHHFGHRHRHKHPHRHHHKHGCPSSSQSRPEDAEHKNSSNGEHQENHEGSAPPPHGGHHHHHHPHHCPPPPPHGGPHTPLQEEPKHSPSASPSHDEQHHSSPSQEELHQHPSPPPHDAPHNHDHHRRPHRPPPHGPHHHHPPPHHGSHCPPPHGPHHHHPPPHHGSHCPPPPPHGPRCPPPPPHGPHHHHPPPHHSPHCPPPPHGPQHHHPPSNCGPHHPPHHHHLCHHHDRHHCNKTGIPGKHFPLQVTGAVYRIPVLNQQDSLTPPTANFLEVSQSNPHSSSTEEDTFFTGSNPKEMSEALVFPDHPTQSKSCPGNPKLILPEILPLFPHSSMAEKSSI
ncbi:histidine-rich glycoprotein [Melanerpes formicivorus]|uniref:histidine-rich glycoprotein n=1 Tax=Melanerpes formicivorus TaxID=211600 RepID=UPI00358F9E64